MSLSLLNMPKAYFHVMPLRPPFHGFVFQATQTMGTLPGGPGKNGSPCTSVTSPHMALVWWKRPQQTVNNGIVGVVVLLKSRACSPCLQKSCHCQCFKDTRWSLRDTIDAIASSTRAHCQYFRVSRPQTFSEIILVYRFDRICLVRIFVYKCIIHICIFPKKNNKKT